MSLSSSEAWRLLLHLALAAALVQAQTGFVSIDCGMAEGTTYTDEETGIFYSSDAGFIETGENKAAMGVSSAASVKRQYRNMRVFPSGVRNCYTLKPVEKGSRYFMRASFLYGDREGTEEVPQFDLYVGINLWTRVNLAYVSAPWWTEIVTVATTDFISVCLVNTGTGSPFISALELRPVKDSMYRRANTTQSLVAMWIYNIGAATDSIIRYPEDPYDRLWQPYTDPSWARLATSMTVSNAYEGFEPPSAVMQTAGTPSNASQPMFFNWKADDPHKEFHVYRHFADFQDTDKSETLREINCCKNKISCFAYEPEYLVAGTVYSTCPWTDALQYWLSFERTSTSNLPPILNALEIYAVQSLDQSATDVQDVYAITNVKEVYGLKKGWMGDPCLPSKYSWDGLKCSYGTDEAATITSLDLSSSGLTGNINVSIGNLKNIQYLDLSNNNLSGAVPEFLSTLSNLAYLNLSLNQFSGPIPLSLTNKAKSGSLTLSVDPNLCTWEACNVADPWAKQSSRKSRSFIVPVAIIASVSVAAILIMGLIFWYKCRRQRGKIGAKSTARREESFELENKRFTRDEIVSITNNFLRVLGKGGFGIVYHGQLEDGREVAVKMLSEDSQASLEFQTEAQLLMALYHRNLVRLVGFCAEGNTRALILEYMSMGDLRSLLSASNRAGEALSWNQRIRIALDVAQGIEYLHVGCKPPIIHRDVKASNILLDEKLEAKIADFGICKVCSDERYSHTSTQVRGTHGYLDPEYYNSSKLNEKSDVYSYGVVLLELITGQKAIINISEDQRMSLVEWVVPFIDKGDVRAIVDSKLQGNYNVTSAWKATEIAIQCTQPKSIRRPTMSNVVSELKDCLAVERANGISFNLQTEGFDTRDATDSMFNPIAR